MSANKLFARYAGVILLSALTSAPVFAAEAAPAPASVAAPSGAIERETGVLPTGYPYQISVPKNWNGIIIIDLDAATNHEGALAKYLLARGYAHVGTGRHPERMTKNDPLAELDAQVAVLQKVTAKYGKGKHTIQMGCSGGGFTALAMAEKHPEMIAGAVAFNARGTGGLAVANTWLDLPFALKGLLAPNSNLKIAPVPPNQLPAAYDEWAAVLEQARKTPEGRARVALAVVLAQYPTWGAIGGSPPPKPAASDLDAVELAMFRSASDGLQNAVTRRQLYDNVAGLASWNTGVDYARFYAQGASPEQKEIISRLYERAGLGGASGVAADLAKINAQPRIEGSRGGVNYWLAPGRLLAGDIKVPVLHIHGLGDALLPPHLLQGYASEVKKKGRDDLYRTAFIDATGHCSQSVAETMAAVETMVLRLKKGVWPDTSPPSLAARASALNLQQPRFVSHDFTPFNRAYWPGLAHPF
jgi:pimeloyl-ACP methyl ester carboxylesterase